MLKSDGITIFKVYMRLIISILIISCSVVTGQDYPVDTRIILSQNEKDLLAKDEIIIRELSSNREVGKTVEAVGLIKADIDEVYRVLIGFEDYHEFMPNVTRIEILKTINNKAILNYIIELPLNKIKKYRLDMSYQLDDDIALLHWTMVQWPGLKGTETIRNTTGYWIIKNYPEKQGHVIALYHVYTDPGPIPLGLGWIVDILTYNSVPTVLLNTRERVYSVSR